MKTGELLPIGFLGPVRAWTSLAPAAARSVHLPSQRDKALAAGAAFDFVEVTAWTESLGRIEDLLPKLSACLAECGTLLLDIDNIQCARMLRLVVEGRPGQFDPAGCNADPTLFLPLRRVLAATAASGLWVQDVIAVPPAAAEFSTGMTKAMFENGLLPLDWLEGPPPPRYWMSCRKGKPLAGSVVLAGGDAAARARTEAAVRSFLPSDWEVVVGDGVRECAQWNRAVSTARGELVWFLRGGAEPTAELFAAQVTRAAIAPIVPGVGGGQQYPGDVVGLMLPRLDVLFVGPLPEDVINAQVALEEWTMRAEAKLAPVQVAAASLQAPQAPMESPASFVAETEALVARWAPIQPTGLLHPAETGAPVVAAAPTSPTSPPWAGRAPRVSLCMIARDEERFLPECLERAKDAADEIIVVDTGSKDRTVQIAESFGAKVVHSPWQDDFSAPRNVGLEVATGDWILVLDADEFLQPGACERIRELVQDPKALGYHLRFVNVFGDGKTLGVMMVRLFRNLPGIAYENVIHEQVTPSLQRLGSELGLVLGSADVEVEHHGYSAAVMDSRGKNERNERLFQKQMAQTPEDVYVHYKYGDFLRRVPGRSADARRLLDRCLELILTGSPSLPRGLPYASEVAALCALEAARCGDQARAGEVIDVALRRFIPTPNLHYLAAGLALAANRCDDAIAHYRRCLAYHGQVLVVPIQEGITGHVSLAGIAQAWLQRGDFDRALPMLERAIALEPTYEVAQLALSRLWLQRGDNARAVRVLTNFLAAHPDSAGACQQLTLILQRLGQTAAAKRIGRHAVQLLEARALEHEAAAMNKLLAAM